MHALRILPALGLALAFGTAGAVTVHTWVDEAGVRHFADAPPAAADTQSETLVLADLAPPDGTAAEDPYSIVNQWQRVRAEREARDAASLERERLRAAQRDARAAAAPEPPVRSYGGYPLFLPYGLPHAGRHHARPRGFRAPPGGRIGERRRSVVHVPPPEWPRQRFFRR